MLVRPAVFLGHLALQEAVVRGPVSFQLLQLLRRVSRSEPPVVKQKASRQPPGCPKFLWPWCLFVHHAQHEACCWLVVHSLQRKRLSSLIVVLKPSNLAGFAKTKIRMNHGNSKDSGKALPARGEGLVAGGLGDLFLLSLGLS